MDGNSQYFQDLILQMTLIGSLEAFANRAGIPIVMLVLGIFTPGSLWQNIPKCLGLLYSKTLGFASSTCVLVCMLTELPLFLSSGRALLLQSLRGQLAGSKNRQAPAAKKRGADGR